MRICRKKEREESRKELGRTTALPYCGQCREKEERERERVTGNSSPSLFIPFSAEQKRALPSTLLPLPALSAFPLSRLFVLPPFSVVLCLFPPPPRSLSLPSQCSPLFVTLALSLSLSPSLFQSRNSQHYTVQSSHLLVCGHNIFAVEAKKEGKK